MAKVKVERWEPVLREEIQADDRIRAVSEGDWFGTSERGVSGLMGKIDYWFERLVVEEVDLDPNEGHVFHFDVTTQGAYGVEGEPDLEFSGIDGPPMKRVTVQGFNLRDAIEALAARPITDFFHAEL